MNHIFARQQRDEECITSSSLGRWRLLARNGVVEIVADRGVAALIQQTEWDEICREMERQFRDGRFMEGSVAAVHSVGRLLARHFPAARHDADELPNQPVLL